MQGGDFERYHIHAAVGNFPKHLAAHVDAASGLKYSETPELLRRVKQTIKHTEGVWTRNDFAALELHVAPSLAVLPLGHRCCSPLASWSTLAAHLASSPRTYIVDGGTNANSNPALLLYRMATEPAYRLQWPTGERGLLIVSVGTGSAPALGQAADSPEKNLVGSAVQTLSALMNQAAFDQDLSCRTIGRCVHGWPLDSEVGTLIPTDQDGRPVPLSTDLGRAFLYARYDAALTPAGLSALGCGDLDPAAVSTLDSVEHMDALERIGRAVAAGVRLEDFDSFVA